MAESRRFMRNREGDIDRSTGKPFVYDYSERAILNLGMIECDAQGKIIDPNKGNRGVDVERANLSEVSDDGGSGAEEKVSSQEDDKTAGAEMREYRVSALVEVMEGLPADTALYTNGGEGPPKVPVLDKALDEMKAQLKVPISNVRADERDEAWERFKKSKMN